MMKLSTSGALAAVLLSGRTQNDPVINFSKEANQAALPQAATAPPTSSPSPTETSTSHEAHAIGVAQRILQECIPAADRSPSEARKFLCECAAGEQLESLTAAVGEDMDPGDKDEGNYTLSLLGSIA